MIDITVGDDNTVEVEMKKYYLDYFKPYHNRNDLIKAIIDIIDRVKYSGETVVLSKVEGDMKLFVKEWS